jgi:hypothetical protein
MDEPDAAARRHTERFRKVSNPYPRLVTAAYGGDLAAAAADSDEQVAARVAAFERDVLRAEPYDWARAGRIERGDDDPDLPDDLPGWPGRGALEDYLRQLRE